MRTLYYTSGGAIKEKNVSSPCHLIGIALVFAPWSSDNEDLSSSSVFTLLPGDGRKHCEDWCSAIWMFRCWMLAATAYGPTLWNNKWSRAHVRTHTPTGSGSGLLRHKHMVLWDRVETAWAILQNDTEGLNFVRSVAKQTCAHTHTHTRLTNCYLFQYEWKFGVCARVCEMRIPVNLISGGLFSNALCSICSSLFTVVVSLWRLLPKLISFFNFLHLLSLTVFTLEPSASEH